MYDRPINANDTTSRVEASRKPILYIYIYIYIYISCLFFLSFFFFLFTLNFKTSFQLLQVIYGSFRILVIKMFREQSDVATAGLAPPPGIPGFKLSFTHARAGFISR